MEDIGVVSPTYLCGPPKDGITASHLLLYSLTPRTCTPNKLIFSFHRSPPSFAFRPSRIAFRPSPRPGVNLFGSTILLSFWTADVIQSLHISGHLAAIPAVTPLKNRKTPQ